MRQELNEKPDKILSNMLKNINIEIIGTYGHIKRNKLGRKNFKKQKARILTEMSRRKKE